MIFVLYIKFSDWKEITRKAVIRLEQENRELLISEDIKRLNTFQSRIETHNIEAGLEVIKEEESIR